MASGLEAASTATQERRDARKREGQQRGARGGRRAAVGGDTCHDPGDVLTKNQCLQKRPSANCSYIQRQESGLNLVPLVKNLAGGCRRTRAQIRLVFGHPQHL